MASTDSEKKNMSSGENGTDEPSSSETTEPSQANEVQQIPEPLFSIFTRNQKTLIVFVASIAALFSPLSANIYYPALGTLAHELHVSNSSINLTVTSYLIFQGLAPMFIGSIADTQGRRPAYFLCFTIYIAACIGLALQSNYAALFVLRCLQSSGSSGTVALASAVVADVVTSAERGTYMGYSLMGGLIGPAFGPIIGGLLDKFLGWRAIFWFLVIFGGIWLLVIIIFLPETCRKVVGNGSIPAQPWNVSLISWLDLRKMRKAGEEPDTKTRLKRERPNPLNTVYIIFDKESGPILFYAGILFAGFYMVITALPSMLTRKFHYNSLQVGLVYLPAGIGSMLAAFVSGRFMDWNFRRLAKLQGMEISLTKQQDLTNFPIEKARLQVVLPLAGMSAILVIVYGWVFEKTDSVGGVVVLLFFTTLTTSSAYQGLSTLVVDLNRSSPGAATAAMNVARCWMGAGGVAAVVPLINAIGVGWTSVLMAGVWVLFAPLVLLVITYGPEWRRVKKSRIAKKKEEKEKKRAENDIETGEGQIGRETKKEEIP